MSTSPYTLSAAAAQILDALTDGLAVHDSRKIDAGHGYMAVHVERLGPSLFSVAHYFVQEGDLCCDPDMTFFRAHGGWMPASFQQAIPPVYQEALEFDGDRPVRYRERLTFELKVFADSWMSNIAEQQGGVAAIRAAWGAR